ncbi:MAG: hypothetical protein ABIJ19_02005 [Patescibacteria group bacterium]
MAIIKKPIYKTLFYLSSLLGLVLALITGIFLGTSQHNLSQLKNKAESIFGSINIIPSAKADIPSGDGCSGDSGGGDDGSSGSCDSGY